jgi:hypothetical protein
MARAKRETIISTTEAHSITRQHKAPAIPSPGLPLALHPEQAAWCASFFGTSIFNIFDFFFGSEP